MRLLTGHRLSRAHLGLGSLAVSIALLGAVLQATPGTAGATGSQSSPGPQTPTPLTPSFLPPGPAPSSGSLSLGPSELATPPAPDVVSEGFSSFSHWQRHADGTVTTSLSSVPVYARRAGRWVAVDGSLHPSSDPSLPVAAEGAVRPIRFGHSASELLVIGLDAGPVTLSAPGLSIGSPRYDSSAGTVTFAGVAASTDLRYVASAAGVKEQLVLRSAQAPTSFTVHVADPAGQLGTANPDGAGGYVFSGLVDGDVALHLPAPVAFPGDGVGGAAQAGSAHLSVAAAGDGFDVTVSVDAAWLSSQSFPVTLDPTVDFDEANNTVTDGYAVKSPSTCNTSCVFTQDTTLPAGSFTGTYFGQAMDWQPAESFLKFNLSSIPTGSTVSAANMALFDGGDPNDPNAPGCVGGYSNCANNTYAVEVDQMNAAWTTASTYSQLNAAIGATAATKTYNPFTPKPAYQPKESDFNLASLVSAWVGGSTANNGVAVRQNPSSFGGPDYYSSREAWPFHPQLNVTYTPPAGAPLDASLAESAAVPGATVTASWAPPASVGIGTATYSLSLYQVGNPTPVQTATTSANSYTFSSLGISGATYYVTIANGTASAQTNNVSVPPERGAGAGSPVLTTTVTNDLGSGTTYAKGQTASFALNVRPSGDVAQPISSVTDNLAGLDLSGSDVTTTSGGQTRSCLNNPPVGSPTCQLTNGTLTISSLATGPNYTFSFRATIVGTGDRGCAMPDSLATAVSADGSESLAATPIEVCDTGLGVENWWTYGAATPLGDGETAKMNAANGNLVVTATDSTPVQAHGHLSYVVRRTFNSQEDALLALPGTSIGNGWHLNIAQADDLIGDGVGADGLYVPPAEQVTNPPALDVTLIDRDGTRHVFRSKGLGASASLTVVGLSGALGTLAPRVLAAATGAQLCVDQSFAAPAGVHLSLWRYVSVGATATCQSTTAARTLVGFAAERPDRLRYEFDAAGRFLDLADGAGNELAYTYDGSGRLTTVDEPAACAAAPTTCRKLTLSYPNGAEIDLADPGRPGLTKYLINNSPVPQLIKVVNPDGSSENYAYATTCGDARGALCSVTDARGDKTNFTYATGSSGTQLATVADRRSVTQTVTFQTPDYVTVDTPAPVGAGERRRFEHIDAAGRVAVVSEGDTTDQYLHQSFFTWDGDPDAVSGGSAVTCRLPDGAVDNDLCHSLTRSLKDLAGTQSFSADADVAFTYNAEGATLVRHQLDSPANLDTTYGYHAQYVEAGGAVTAYDDTVSGYSSAKGQGWVNAPAGGGTNGARGDASTLYYLSDRTQVLPARANLASPAAPFNAYLTTYHPDVPVAGVSVNPNASATANTCNLDSSLDTNTGLVCETDTPASAGVAEPATFPSVGARCVGDGATRAQSQPWACVTDRYDTYGQKTSMTTAKSNAETPSGTTPPAYTYTYYADTDTDLSASVSAGGWLRAVGDPAGHFVAYAYDHAGNTTRTWDRDATAGHAVAEPWNVAATPPSPAYAETLHASGAGAYSSPWRYVVSSRDPLGNLTTFTNDPNGNQTAIRPPRGNAAGNASYDVTQTFDAADHLLTHQTPAEAGHPTSYGYDNFANQSSVTDPDGKVETYAYDAVNRKVTHTFTLGPWSAANAPSACRQSNAADTPIPAGRILCSENFGYDGEDNLMAHQDGNHQTSYFAFDGAGRKIVASTPRADGTISSLITETAYDADGHPTDVCSPRAFTEGSFVFTSTTLTPCAPSSGTGAYYGTHTAYDLAGRAASSTTYRESVTSFDPSDCTPAGAAPRVQLTTTTAYDADGNAVAVTDPRCHTATTAYDLLDRKTSTTTPRSGSGSSAVTETTTYNDDPAGNTLSVVAPGDGTTARITDYAYDADNRTTDVITGAANAFTAGSTTLLACAAATYANGGCDVHTRAVYDPDGRVAGRYDARAFADGATVPDASYLVRTDFDVDGRPIATFVPRYGPAAPDTGLSATQGAQCPTNPAPPQGSWLPAYPAGVGVCVTRASYDAAGNRTQVRLGTSNGTDNRYLSYAYTDNHLVSSVEAPLPGGTPPSTSCPTASGPSRVTAWCFVYDADNKEVLRTDAMGVQQSSAYNADETLRSVTGSAGPGGLTHTTSYVYDANGNQTQVTDPAGQVSTTRYNADNTRAETCASLTLGSACTALGATPAVDGDHTTYAYDADANSTSVTSPSANAGDANNPHTSQNPGGVATRLTYTQDNLLSTSLEPTTAGSQGRETDYGYDPAGRKSAQDTRLDNWDGSGTPSLVTDAGTLGFSYFPDDRMASQTSRDGGTTIVRTYDPAGNTTCVGQGPAGTATCSSAATVETASYYLDTHVRTASESAAGSPGVAYSYDGQGSLAARSDTTAAAATYTTTYAYDDAELAATMSPAFAQGATLSWGYDPAGRPTTLSNPAGESLTLAYNTDDTLASQTTAFGGTTAAAFSYGYDHDYRITSQAQSGDATFTYAYDAAGRMASYTAGSRATMLTSWDHDGNRLCYATACPAGTSGQTFTYNADNTIHTATDNRPATSGIPQVPPSAQPTTYTYNAAGDLTCDGLSGNTYDGFDRLATAKNLQVLGNCPGQPSALGVTYAYDGLDRQRSAVSTTVAVPPTTSTTTYHYDGLAPAAAVENASGTPGSDTVFALDPNGTAVGVTTTGPTGSTTWLGPDGEGNVTTERGGTTCDTRYDPFGNPVDVNGNPTAQPCAGAQANDRWYRGERRDTTTGSYQLGSRTYDPTKDSFLTADTYRSGQPSQDLGVHTDPLTENTYSYVNGDPVNLSDPTGHLACADLQGPPLYQCLEVLAQKGPQPDLTLNASSPDDRWYHQWRSARAKKADSQRRTISEKETQIRADLRLARLPFDLPPGFDSWSPQDQLAWLDQALSASEQLAFIALGKAAQVASFFMVWGGADDEVAFAGVAPSSAGLRLVETGQQDLWSLSNKDRGLIAEEAIAGGARRQLPAGFETIDTFQNGIAESIKTIDLKGITYQNIGKLQSLLSRYLNKVADFPGTTKQNTITEDMVAGRALTIGIEPGVATPQQWLALYQTTLAGKDIGVDVSVVFVR